jgi:hypothetical protein
MNRLFLILLSALMLASCGEETSPESEAENFARIYDNNIYSFSFSPIDMIQTADGGYVILATRFTPEDPTNGVYLLKADQAGNFIKDLPMGDSLLHPLNGMTLQNGKLHFVCMDESAMANLVTADENLETVSAQSLNLTYPAASSFANDGFLILSYDQIEKRTVVSKVSLAGNIMTSRYFTISYDDTLEDEIINHFLRSGTHFPFQVGQLPGGAYFFNGFYDYTFSLVFTSLGGDDDVDGVVQGQQDNGGFSAITPIGGDVFAASYYTYGDNYILPRTSLSTNGLSSLQELDGFGLKEMAPFSTIQILRTQANGKNVIIYAGNTLSKQIGLFMYDETTGDFMGSRYFGFSNPYEFGRMMLTEDGGLAISGTTFIAGRFSRICLFKISKTELNALDR